MKMMQINALAFKRIVVTFHRRIIIRAACFFTPVGAYWGESFHLPPRIVQYGEFGHGLATRFCSLLHP